MPPQLTEVAECLYRNAGGTYFALLKVQQRQIKRSLKTSDLFLVRRRLSELRTKAEGLAGDEKGMRFEQLTERWLANRESELRPATFKMGTEHNALSRPIFQRTANFGRFAMARLKATFKEALWVLGGVAGSPHLQPGIS